MIKITFDCKDAKQASAVLKAGDKAVLDNGGYAVVGNAPAELSEEEELARLLGDSASSEPEITVEMVQQKVAEVAKASKENKTKIAALLKEYKAQGVSKLDKGQLAPFFKELSKLVA